MSNPPGRRPRPSSYAGPRQSMFSGSNNNNNNNNATGTISGLGPAPATSASAAKNRHLSHLHSQLAQLSANLSDLENLLRMTAVQAESMRGLGGWSGGMFMAASKVLGEEAVAKHSSSSATTTAATNATTGVATEVEESSVAETTTTTREEDENGDSE